MSKADLKPINSTNSKWSLLFLLVATLVFSSCSTQKPAITEGGAYYTLIDFQYYANKGFLYTPEKPTGEYASRGLVYIDLEPKIIRIGSSEYNNLLRSKDRMLEINGVWYSSAQFFVINNSRLYYAVSETNIQDALDEMYELAVSIDADAITNLTISTSTTNDEGLVYTIIKLSGFAIRRSK